MNNKTENNIDRQFEVEFATDTEKSNFKHLRDFLRQKEKEKILLTEELRNNNISLYDIDNMNGRLEYLNKVIATSGNNDEKTVELADDSYVYGYNAGTKLLKLNVIKKIRDDLIRKKARADADLIVSEKIKTSLKNIDQDIEDCQTQIDETLNPENKTQYFKKIMSLSFVALIALILICFFSIIYLRSDLTLSKDLLGGYGLQFITLFVLIIAIILFGILDILKGSELAAMLSGISGYILGKGIQDKKLITENNNLATTLPPVVTETTITNVNPELNPL